MNSMNKIQDAPEKAVIGYRRNRWRWKMKTQESSELMFNTPVPTGEGLTSSVVTSEKPTLEAVVTGIPRH